MSTPPNRTTGSQGKAAREAILTAIADEVAKIDKNDHQSNRAATLKTLAEAYNLVTYGPTKSV